MYYLIVDYFDGIRFLVFDHVPVCRAWIDRQWSNFWAFNFAREGSILWKDTAGNMIQYDAPVAWWTWPGRQFVYGCLPGQSWNHYYVGFRGPRSHHIFSRGLAHADLQACITPVSQSQRMALRFEELLFFLRHPLPDPLHHAHAVHLLEELFLLAHHLPSAQPHHGPRQKITDLVMAISRQPQSLWNFAHEARRLSLSRVHFSRLVKQATGLSPQRFLIRCRLQYAAQLLQTGQWSVKQVASQVRYNDSFHFGHAFKSHFGVSPGRYQRGTQGLSGPSIAPDSSTFT